MAVEADNMCFENFAYGTPQFVLDSGFGVHDGSCLQELQQQFHPVTMMDSGNHNTAIVPSSLPVEIAQCLVSDMEKQMKELDWYLQWENKRLRRSILQETKRQQTIILQKYDALTRAIMVQKDEEIATARNRTRELQNLSTAAEMEAKAWEITAKEKDALISDLNKKLNRAREKDFLQQFPVPFPHPPQEDGAVSFCGSSESSSSYSERMTCKLCQARSLCVVFLPCRHLCCCKFCEALLGQCPVCQTVKEETLEVSLG